MPLGDHLPAKLREAIKQQMFYAPIIRHRGITLEKPGLFSAVFFEVVTRCNSRCQFCNASIQNEKRDKREMPFALYKKVVDDLAGLNYPGRLAWHVNNDPLLFSNLEEFVAYARRQLPRNHLQILTNGIALTPERGQGLLEAGISEIQIDFYRERKGQRLYKNLETFINEVIPKFYPRKQGENYLSQDSQKRFQFKIINRYLDEILTSRGGNSPNKERSRGICAGFCIYPWTQFNVTTDGRVSKCCSDFYFGDPMGNVTEQSVLEIWHGEKFAGVRRQLWQGQRESLANCAQCDFFGVKNSHFANPLLKALKYHFFAHN